MENKSISVTVKEIALLVGGEIVGNANKIITKPAKIEEADSTSITFFSNPKYEKYIYESNAGAILVSRKFTPSIPISATLIKVDDVYATISFLLDYFSKNELSNLEMVISDKATIASDVKINTNTVIGDFSVISKGASIGASSVIYSQVYIGMNVSIGKDCIIYPGVKIYRDCVIGDNVVIHSNTVIGSDGFGFAPQADGTFKKVPQIGNVIIKNNVEIGANCAIDRATMGSTIIHNGVKLDNFIQIAHNVEIGENTVIASQSGVAGSTKVGKNCMIGGQVGIVGHLTIADGTKIQAQSGVASSVETPNTALFGSPAITYIDYIKSFTIFKKLPELAKKIDKIEKLLSLKK